MEKFDSNPKSKTALVSNGAKPLASLSLDLDNLWSYLKTHGDPNWEGFPSYIDFFIPRILDVLDQLNLRITFFIVGQDAALEKNQDALKLITQSGHEVGNHSFSHEPWLHLYSKDKIKAEINAAEEHIKNTTGQRPIGFRGPGFSWSPDLLEVLNENGYQYDASSLPTFLGPLARAYYFWTSNLSTKEKEKRKKLFGSFKDGMRPVRPYFLTLESGMKLLEIPVTTMPVCRTPFHLSYLIYLHRYSRFLMSFYFKTALTLCRITRTAPSFLLHPLDFLDSAEVPELSFFPGMKLNRNKKIEIFHYVMNSIRKYFSPVNMSTYAEKITAQKELKNIKVYSDVKFKQTIISKGN
jgi:hypothetical protein